MSEVEYGVEVDLWNSQAHAGHKDTITVTRYEQATARCDRCGDCFWTGPIYDGEDVGKAYLFHRHEGCRTAPAAEVAS